MTADELYAGMIGQGLYNSFYSISTLVYAFPGITSQQMTALVVKLVKDGKVEFRRTNKRTFQYHFLKGK